MKRTAPGLAPALAACTLLWPAIAEASVTLTVMPAGRELTVVADYRAIEITALRLSGPSVPIDWQNFTISSGGNVSLQQPPAVHGVLNRVAGGDVRLTVPGIMSTSGLDPDRPRLSVSQVPEPSSWLMLLAGLVLLGGLARRPGRRMP